jgi:hypothetical protein
MAWMANRRTTVEATGKSKTTGCTLQGDVLALVCLSLHGPSFVAGNWIGTRTFLVAYDKAPLRDGVRNPEKVAKLACANLPINATEGAQTSERALSLS